MIRPKALMDLIDARLARHGKLGSMLVKGAVGTGGIRLANAAIGFVTTIVLAKMLAPSGYGIYSFVMALVALVAIPSELGIPKLAVREIATTNARKDWDYMRGFIIRSHQAIVILTALLMVAGLCGLSLWGDRLDAVKQQAMWVGLLVVPLVSLGALRGAMLRGLRKVVLGQLPEQIFRPMFFLCLIVSLPLLTGSRGSVFEVMLAQVVASALAFIGGLHLFFRNRPAEIRVADPRYKTAAWLKSTVPFGLIAAIQLINGRTDILMLGFFREDAEVGIYRVASQMALLIIFGLRAINAIQGPHIAHLYATGDIERLQKMITRSSQAILATSIPFVLVFVVLGQFLIRTLFGEAFVGAYVPLVILCAGQLVNASLGSVASLLNMTGHERDTTRSLVVSAVANVVLNVTLAPIWGAIGAAIATSATLIIWNVLMWRRVYARLGIHSSPLYRGRTKQGSE